MTISDWTKFFRHFSKKTPKQSTELSDADIVLGHTSENEAVIWPKPTLVESSSVLCLGASGSRKTTTIVEMMIREALRDPDTSHLILDPKGDMVAYIFQAISLYGPENLNRIYYLEPFTTGFHFNLVKLPRRNRPAKVFAWQLASLVGRLTTDAAGPRKDLSTGARQLDGAMMVIESILLSEHPDATLLWGEEALTRPGGVEALAALSPPDVGPRMLAAIQGLSPDLKVSIASRMRLAFSGLPILADMMAAPGCIDIGALLNAKGAIVIVDLSDPLGLGELRPFLANLIFRLGLDSLLERSSPHEGHHTRIWIDELQIVSAVLSSALEDAVATIRSRGGSLVGLSQGTVALAQASPALLPGLLSNTRKLVGRLNAEDALLLAKHVAPAGSDESFGAIRARVAARAVSFKNGEFYWIDNGKRTRFSAVNVDVDSWKEAAKREAESIEVTKQRLALAKGVKHISLLDAARAWGTAPIEHSATKNKPRKTKPRWG